MPLAPETSVRRYLLSLTNPDALVDDDEVARLTGELDELTDPIDRLRARQRLLDASEPDVQSAEEDFVVVAKDWAASQGISAAAFVAEGVPPAVLRRAGIRVPTGASTKRKRRANATRSSRVSREQIKGSVPPSPFTAATLIDLTGASPNAVRKTIGDMLDEGTVVEKGQDPDHAGPGRAPMLYAAT